MKYSPKSEDSSQFPFKDLPSGALGKPRDRSTFKGVFDKFVGSFNGKVCIIYKNEKRERGTSNILII